MLTKTLSLLKQGSAVAVMPPRFTTTHSFGRASSEMLRLIIYHANGKEMTTEIDVDKYPPIYPSAYSALEKLWEVKALIDGILDDVDRFIGLGVPTAAAKDVQRKLQHLVGERGDFRTHDLYNALFEASEALNDARRASGSCPFTDTAI